MGVLFTTAIVSFLVLAGMVARKLSVLDEYPKAPRSESVSGRLEPVVEWGRGKTRGAIHVASVKLVDAAHRASLLLARVFMRMARRARGKREELIEKKSEEITPA